MGMLLILVLVFAVIGVGYLFVHAVRSDANNRHGWLVVLPMAVIVFWIVEQMVTG